MRSCCFLLFLVVLVFIVVSVVFDTSLATSREIKFLDEPLKGVAPTVEPVDNISNRLLRVESEAAGPLVKPAINGLANSGWMSSIIKDIWVRLKMKYWLRRKVEPETIKKKMKIASTEDKKYKQYYGRYFYQYYIKYLEEPLSKMSGKNVEDIWKARLAGWLANDLSLPQVAELMGFKSITLAAGQPNFKYLKKYQEMYGEKQMRLQKLGGEMENVPLR